MSSFLTFIIFCFLLYLEKATEEQKTFRNLDSGLTLVSANLDWLSDQIPPPDENPASEEIQKRIEDFIRIVSMSHDSLRSKGENSVKAGIRITLEVNKIPASIVAFRQSPKALTPEAFNKLLDEIVTIWDVEIQPLIDEAVK